MKCASVCSAGDVSVRLCFLVNMRKANGRNVAGGSEMGSIDGVASSGGFRSRTGYTGVAKAGEDDGMWFAGTGERAGGNIGAAPVDLSITRSH